MNDCATKLGVLISGRGSNLRAILDHQQAGFFHHMEVACVVSDIPGAAGLEIARAAGIPSSSMRPRDYPAKADYEAAVAALLEQHGVNLVALAGYMRLVGPTLLERFANRIVNIHPSLLPSFPGLHAQRQAVEHGVRISGCTVHFVDAGLDSGPIIGQRAVEVLPDDDEDALSERILVQEHRLYSECLRRITEERHSIRGRTVVFA